MKRVYSSGRVLVVIQIVLAVNISSVDSLQTFSMHSIHQQQQQQQQHALMIRHRSSIRSPLCLRSSSSSRDEDDFLPLEAVDRLQSTLNRIEDIIQTTDDSTAISCVHVHQDMEDGDSSMSRQMETPAVERATEQVANLIILGLGTYAMTTGMELFLVQFEWFQAWRYCWPLLGALFVVHSFLPAANSAASHGLLPFQTNPLWRFLAAVSGIGLIVGGVYDMFMPVWETGPNVLTSAGIGQDSAAALLLLTLHAIFWSGVDKAFSIDSNNKNPSNSITPILLQMILLGQLSVLAEGSTEEIVARLIELL